MTAMEHAESAMAGAEVRGLAASASGMALDLTRTPQETERATELGFRIVDDAGEPITDFELGHERRMHLIVVRRDLTGFQHLHPVMGKDGEWTTPIAFEQPGTYRVFADFMRDGSPQTLAGDIQVGTGGGAQPLPRRPRRQVRVTDMR